MRKPKELPEGALESLATGLRQAKTKAEFQSVQCVWLRASLRLSAEQVSTVIGWHPNSVRKLQARYFKEGEAALRRGGRGGRYYQNLTLKEERQILQEFLALILSAGIVPLRNLLSLVFMCFTWPLKYSDYLFRRLRTADNIASSFYSYGMKSVARRGMERSGGET